MQIAIRIEKNYGVEVVYPVCASAHKFAQISKTKTLTIDTLSLIKSLGYELVIEEARDSLASKLRSA